MSEELKDFIDKSPIRQNIINWCSLIASCSLLTSYRFNKSASILHIAPKEDSITSYLKSVSDIVELMTPDELLNADLEKSFDYIICIGNEEFYNNQNDYKSMLGKSKELLNSNGTIILALNNRLAMDTWLNKDMRGSFSKTELLAAFKEIGLYASDFFYPYPNYTFPNEIFTDFTLRSQKYGRNYINIYEGFIEGFDRPSIAWDLANENVLDKFVNSLLVIITKDESLRSHQAIDSESVDESEKIIYAKLNNDRNEMLRTATLITINNKDKKHIYKKALNKSAKEHINRIFENENKTISSNITNLKGKLEEELLIYDYINEKSLDTILKEYIERGQAETVISKITEWFDKYFSGFNIKNVNYLTDEFKRVFGEGIDEKSDCITPANIDLIFDNIYVKEDNYTLIDCEWVFDFYVPVDFIKWRAINELYCKYWEALNKLIQRDNMLLRFGIDTKQSSVYQEFSEHFAKVYVGSSTLEKCIKPAINIPVKSIIEQKKNEFSLTSSLYYDLGEGFLESNRLENTVVMRQEADGYKSFIQGFNLKDKSINIEQIKKLRFDPLEGSACECIIDNINGVKGFRVYSQNAGQKDEKELFMTLDPAYIIEGSYCEGTISIYGKIKLLSAHDIMLKYNELKAVSDNSIKNKIKGLLNI